MDRLGDSPELKNLLNSLTEFIQDPNRDRVEMPKDKTGRTSILIHIIYMI